MEKDENEEVLYDYDENATIDEDEIDSNLSGENDIGERIRNIQDINLYKLLSKRRKFIQFCFNKILFLSIIPTLIYNIFWIIKMKDLNFENIVNFDLSEFKNCIIFACYLTLAKGIIILFFPQIRCGTGRNLNDFSFICVFIKLLTTFIYSNYLTSYLEKKFNSFKNINSIDEIYYWINLFYKFECLYIKGIYTIVGIILISFLLSILKELYKAIRYVL